MIFDKEDYKAFDPELWNAIDAEAERQQNNIELIASENVVSKAVMAAQGTLLTNKYAEGYPGKRYYGGTDVIDVVESLAIERAKELFGAKFANVQPHSGSQANAAVYMSLIQPGDTVMGMDLSAGGHLTHGAPVSFSGKTYNFVAYNVDKETELLDYFFPLEYPQQKRKSPVKSLPPLVVLCTLDRAFCLLYLLARGKRLLVLIIKMVIS